MINLKKIKNNKFILIILAIVLFVTIYSCLNTFIINDDLPYSFYYRTSTRITNVIQILFNQKSDYFNINSRVIVHCIVQLLLIFGKKIWSFLNPFVIVMSLVLILKIVKIYIKKDNKKLPILMVSSLFLMLISYKQIIYWVAGSVNYVWTGLYLLFLIYLYLKHGYSKHEIINVLLIFSVSILHEALLVFSIVFVSITYIENSFKNKKIITSKIIYFIPLIISYIFLMKAPSVLLRLNINSEWNSLNIVEKVFKSLPVVSFNFLNLYNIYNLIPAIFIVLLLLCLIKSKIKYNKIFATAIFILSLLIIFTKNNWFYFLLAIVVFITVIYYNYLNDRNNLSIVFVSMYAVVFSMILTSEYTNGRPNYFAYLFIIILIIVMLYDLLNKKLEIIFTILFSILFAVTIFSDVFVYKNIGDISQERQKNIEECSKNNCEILKLKTVPNKYALYHIDINSPSDSNYFAYKHFINYNKLNKNIKIEFYD